ncbi:glycosyltransferase [Microcoleus sp. FACHB-831]|uniref:glycosyltransferase family 4 protein n=1 Tax=Microcoleus sp. FACHB-831 TaxID=2692827 RepID=UPI0016855A1D|nr:glycosyltransferase [Microcoleus sp. FACHB-831]MBD1920399.1 glycosyltransferase [Microcoleus sp. FACHB-831]
MVDVAVNSGQKISIVFIITGLSLGGAEMMLYKVLSRLDRKQFDPVVVSLKCKGTLGDRISDLSIPVYTIGMKPGVPTLSSTWRLVRTVRQLKPDLIQGWMYHGNLAGQLATITATKPVPVIWNIRHSLNSLYSEKAGTIAVIKFLAKLSNYPAQILYNSKTSAIHHEELGYKADKTKIIPNGFDTDLFAPSTAARSSLRTELGITDNEFIIGLMGRYHPQKDHANFLQAAAILLQTSPDIHFVLAGTAISRENTALQDVIETLGITEQIHLLGERDDMPRLTAALDIASSSSCYGEAFPNVIGEAMSCGVPCVVTDVGDSAWIVGDTGRVVPARDPQALAHAWKDLIDRGAMDREMLGKQARARIIEYFSLGSVVAHYEALYKSLLS